MNSNVKNYDKTNNLCLIEEDFETKKLSISLLYSPSLEKKFNLDINSSKLLKLQEEFYEEYLEDFDKNTTKRKFDKFSKEDFSSIYSQFKFPISFYIGQILNFSSDEDEEIFEKFDSGNVVFSNETITYNKTNNIVLFSNKLSLEKEEDRSDYDLFEFLNKNILTSIPNRIKDIILYSMDEIIDNLMIWITNTSEGNKKRKFTKNILIKKFIKEIKQELQHRDNLILYAIKNHPEEIELYKYITTSMNEKEKNLSNIYDFYINGEELLIKEKDS